MSEAEEILESAEHEETTRRPFKVSGRSRKFKGIVASSLQELKEKCIRSLSLDMTESEVHLYLEEDGTEIDDEEYFQFLRENTRMLALRESDFNFVFVVGASGGLGPNSFERSESQVLIGDTDTTDAGQPLSQGIILTLKTNPTFFVHLSVEDLDTIADTSVEELSRCIGISIPEARVIQQACMKELERRQGLTQATDLLHMYMKATEKEHKLPTQKKSKTETI